MKNTVPHVTISETFDGSNFEQTTAQAGVFSYFVNGTQVDKATWDKKLSAASYREMRNSTRRENEAPSK